MLNYFAGFKRERHRQEWRVELPRVCRGPGQGQRQGLAGGGEGQVRQRAGHKQGQCPHQGGDHGLDHPQQRGHCQGRGEKIHL